MTRSLSQSHTAAEWQSSRVTKRKRCIQGSIACITARQLGWQTAAVFVLSLHSTAQHSTTLTIRHKPSKAIPLETDTISPRSDYLVLAVHNHHLLKQTSSTSIIIDNNRNNTTSKQSPFVFISSPRQRLRVNFKARPRKPLPFYCLSVSPRLHIHPVCLTADTALTLHCFPTIDSPSSTRSI